MLDHISAGRTAELAGDIVGAIEHYQAVLGRPNTRSADYARRRLAAIHHILGQRETALADWEQVIPSSASDMLIYAMLLRRSGRPKSASRLLHNEIAYWLDNLELSPNKRDNRERKAKRPISCESLTLMLRQIVRLLKAGAFNESQGLIITLRQRIDWMLAAHTQWALAAQQIDTDMDMQEALHLRHEILTMIASLIALENLLMRCEARACLGQQIDAAVEPEVITSNLASLTISEAKVDEMLRELHTRYSEELTRSPHHVNWLYQRGMVNGACHDRRAAAVDWYQLLVQIPQATMAATHLAGIYVQDGDNDLAERTLQISDKISPEDLATYYRLALAGTNPEQVAHTMETRYTPTDADSRARLEIALALVGVPLDARFMAAVAAPAVN